MDVSIVKRWRRKKIQGILAVIFLSITLFSNAQGHEKKSPTLAVIYPEVRSPFVAIFKEIIAGINDAVSTSAAEIVVPSNMEVSGLEQQLETGKIDSVIALGSSGLRLSSKINDQRLLVSGAAISTPEKCPKKVSCLSMLPSPIKILESLVNLAPDVKNVYVAYNSSRDSWLIKLASQAAQKKGVELHAVEVKDVRSNALFYQNLLGHLGKDDALWLLQRDSSMSDRNLFGTILKQAWKNDFIVFSSNPAHVKKGTLFAVYPDNKAMGQSLGKMLLDLKNGAEPTVQPLSDLQIAVNLRTAEHLQLELTRAQRDTFDLVFPDR